MNNNERGPVDDLAQFIRRIDGNHSMGAGALAEAIINAGYFKVDHIEYAADHKYAGLEFVDEDGELYTDRATFERDFEDFRNATLMQRTVGPWVPIEPTTEATK